MKLRFQNNDAITALKRKARSMGLPLYGAFELTGRCNLNCKMCYVHVMDAQEARKKELSTEQWKKIMDDAYDAGMLFALLTGGECLIRPDFKELYLHLYNKGVIMSVNTNGVLIDEEMAKFFAQHPPEWVQISLYGSSDAGYEAVTEVRAFSKVARALELLEKHGVTTQIAITPSKALAPDFEEIMKYAISHKLDYRMGGELIEPRDGIRRDPYALTQEEQIDLIAKRRLLEGKTVTPPLELEAPAPCGTCTERVYGVPCNAGTIRFVASWDGKMIPCMSIPEVSIDLLKEDFSTCWQYIRSKIDQVVQPVECKGCVYEKKCTYCPALRYDGLYSGHCNPQACEFVQKKYLAGLIKL